MKCEPGVTHCRVSLDDSQDVVEDVGDFGDIDVLDEDVFFTDVYGGAVPFVVVFDGVIFEFVLFWREKDGIVPFGGKSDTD